MGKVLTQVGDLAGKLWQEIARGKHSGARWRVELNTQTHNTRVVCNRVVATIDEGFAAVVAAALGSLMPKPEPLYRKVIAGWRVRRDDIGRLYCRIPGDEKIDRHDGGTTAVASEAHIFPTRGAAREELKHWDGAMVVRVTRMVPT